MHYDFCIALRRASFRVWCYALNGVTYVLSRDGEGGVIHTL
jgi:hypothetical protein